MSVIYTPPPPAAPALLSPPNKSAGTEIPEFTWDSVDGADDYQIEIATDSKYKNVVDSTPTGGATSYTPASLESGTYYWHVRSINSFGVPGSWSSSFSFTLEPAP